MRVGILPGLHLGLAVSGGLLLATVAPAALAQEAAAGCQAYVDSQWRPEKAESMSGCLIRLDAATSAYDAQGFKFGLWGSTLLSADTSYFYSSMDSGGSWQVVGLKSDIAPSGTPQAAAATKPVARTGLLAKVSDFFTAADDAPAKDAQNASDAMQPRAVSAEASSTMLVGSAQPAARASGTASASYTPARQAVSQRPVANDGEPRNSCNMRIGSRWEVVPNQTLQQCISLFDRSPDQFDNNGFKYGYWSGVYLAANRKEVLQSNDSRDWVTVLNR